MGLWIDHLRKWLTQQLVFTQSVIVLLLQILTSAVSLLTRVVFARLLGVAGYGRFMEIDAWSKTLGIFATLGLDWLLIFDLPRFEAKKQWDEWRGLHRYANRIAVPTSMFCSLVLVGAGYFFSSTNSFGSYGFYIAALFFPFRTFSDLRFASLVGLRKIIIARSISFFRKGPLLLLGVYTVYYFYGKIEMSPATAILLDGISIMLSLAAFSMMVRRYRPEPICTSHTSSMPQKCLIRALPLLFLGSMYIMNTNLDLILIGNLLGPASAGMYSVATDWAGIVTYPLKAFNRVIAPHAAHLYATDQTKKLQQIVRQGLSAATLLSLFILLALYMFSPKILSTYGHGFDDSFLPLLILGFGQLLFSTMGTVWFLLVATENQKIIIWTSLIGIISNIGLNLLFISRWELTGVAISTIITNLFICFLGVHCLKQKTGLVASIFLKS